MGSNPRWSSTVTVTELHNLQPGVPGSAVIDHPNNPGVRTSFPVGPKWVKSCQVWFPKVLKDLLSTTIPRSGSTLEFSNGEHHVSKYKFVTFCATNEKCTIKEMCFIQYYYLRWHCFHIKIYLSGFTLVAIIVPFMDHVVAEFQILKLYVYCSKHVLIYLFDYIFYQVKCGIILKTVWLLMCCSYKQIVIVQLLFS